MIRVLLLIAVAAAGSDTASDDRPPTTLEKVAQRGIGRVLSFVLDAPASVERVRLDREAQVLELKNLRIGNPKGFDGDTAIAVETVLVEADPRLLFSNKPLVRLVKASGAAVNAEVNVSRGLNLKKLMDSAGRFKGPKLLKLLPKKRWRIEKGVLENGAVEITTQLLTKQTTRKTLERYEISLMGKDGKGVTVNEAMVHVLQSLIERAGLLEGSGLEPLVGLLNR